VPLQQSLERGHLRGGDPRMLRQLALAALLVLGVVGASSQDAPRQHKAVSQNQAAERKPQLGSSDQSPVVVKVIPASESEQKATADRENRKQQLDEDMSRFTEDLAKYTRYLAWFTFALITIGVGQLITFGIQA